MQINHNTKLAYSGMNQDILSRAKANMGYKSSEWITYVQARDSGSKLINAKGQGIHCRTFPVDKTTGKQFPRYFVLFNYDLIEKETVSSLVDVDSYVSALGE